MTEKEIAEKAKKLTESLQNDRMSPARRKTMIKDLRNLNKRAARMDRKTEAGINDDMYRDEKMRDSSQADERREKISERRKRQRRNAKNRKAMANKEFELQSKAADRAKPVVKKKGAVVSTTKPAKKPGTAVAKRPGTSLTVQQKAGRKVLGTLIKGSSKLAGLAGMAFTAYDMYATKQKVDTSVKQYEAKAREIAKASAAIKAPPKRGTNVMIAGQKVKIPANTLKKLKTVNVKSRAMDNPAKAKEAAPTAQKAAPKDELTFGQAFAKARRERIKSGADINKATFTWKGKKYHTRTKEEEAKAKKKPMKVGKPGYNRRTVK